MKRPMMRTLTTLATFVLCVVTVAAQGTDARSSRTEDEASVRDNVKQMEAGWNTRQGALFAKPFAQDADYVVLNGIYLKGRAAIEKAHQQIFDTLYKSTTLSLSIRQIRFLRPDVALVHVSGHLSAPENERQFVGDGSMTMVMTRDKQVWRIAAFQNTQVTANQPR